MLLSVSVVQPNDAFHPKLLGGIFNHRSHILFLKPATCVTKKGSKRATGFVAKGTLVQSGHDQLPVVRSTPCHNPPVRQPEAVRLNVYLRDCFRRTDT
jgi:hypothetical protein